MKKYGKTKKCILAILIILFCIMLVMICKYQSGLTLVQLKNNTESQMMGYIIKARNGRVIVVDGGTIGDTENFLQEIKKYGNKVDYWFITHPHKDHAGVLEEVVKTSDIAIGTVYYTINDLEWYYKNETERAVEVENFIDIIKSEKLSNKTVEVELNQKIKIDNIECEIIGVKNPEITNNAINNSSMVIKMQINEKSILFLGDTGIESSEKLIQNQNNKIDVDIVQMAHHGQQGATEELYKIISPEICLWPTPEWLWNNNLGGQGENTGPWKTKETRKWIEKLQVKNNYIEKEGDISIRVY